MQKILHAQTFFHVLVGVDRRDAAAGGAELAVGKAILLHDVLQLVVGHTDDSLVADFQVVRRDGDALLAQVRHLSHQMLQINDHAVTHNVDGGLAQDAGREQIQDELALVVDDGVPRVVAALIAADDVIVGREQIDHTALAFIAPVDSHDCG